MIPPPPFLTATALAGGPVRHGFFTRAGGASTGDFAGLNCSLSGRDDPVAVAANRARAAAALGLPPGALHGVHQVHGAAVAVLEEPWPPDRRPRADALVTRRPGLLLGILTADCAPVLFADAGAGVVGAAHAGWRGAVAGVLEATLEAMRALGATRVTAAVGPCIGAAGYEVGAELRDAVLAAGGGGGAFLADADRPGRWRFDLAGYCVHRLAAAGAAATALGLDTLTDAARFFSHRRNTLAGGGRGLGHQLSAIALVP